MNPEVEETCEMIVKEAGGGSHHQQHKQDTSEPCILAEETVIELNNDGIIDASKCEENKENNDEISNGVCPGNNRNVDSMESVDAKDLEPLTDAVTINEKQINDDTNTEGLLVPKKKVIKQKKLVKKRKLVKGKVTVAKDEEKPQSSDMPDPSDEVRTNQDLKNEENPGNNRNMDSKENVEEVDRQNNEARLASEEGDDEMFMISEDDIREESVMGSEDAKDLEPLTDAITINEKQMNDGTNTKKEVSLVPKKWVIKQKKLVKKRKLVKGKVTVSKDEKKIQSSDIPGPSDEVRTNVNEENEENPDGKTMDNVNNSSIARTKKKNAEQITDKVTVKSKQSGENKQSGKEKMESKSEDMDDLNEQAKSETKSKLRKLTKGAVTAEDKDEAEPSDKQKSSNKVESMGMIFMCSSKTKEDCYHYKILGLPASKKDQVLKIYKGMRLFLFDTDSKLLYGIYKAAGPGGYNIEPKAFKSNYPSQVRFTTVNDCSPLPEEKFKEVIKDNYYTKNKFQSELNSKQVKSLCKLFRVVNKGSKLKAKAVVTERPKARVHPAVERGRKRKARIENNDQGRERRALVDTERDNKRRRVLDEVNHSRARVDARTFRGRSDARRERPKGDVTRSRAEDDVRRRRLEDDARRLRAEDEERRIRFEEDARRLRLEEEERRLRIEEDVRRLRADDRRLHSPLILTENRYPRHPDVFERETYLPSAALSAPLHLDGLPPYTSSYTGSGRPPLLGDYRLSTTFQNEDRGLPYSSRPRNLYEYETPYLPYREPVVYPDPGFDISTRRSYYSPLASRDEYVPSTSRTSRYRLSPYRRH